MWAGTRRMLRLNLNSPMKFITRSLSNSSKLVLNRNPHGSVAALLEDCVDCAVDALMASAGGPTFDETGFKVLLEKVRAGLHPQVLEVLTDVEKILRAANDVEVALPSTRGPADSLADILRTIKQTAQRPAGQGWSSDLGWGILDAGAALALARTIDRRPPFSKIRRMGRRTHHTRLTLRWRGGDQPRVGVFEAGLSGVELWRALDGRQPRKLLSTRKRAIRVKLLRGHRYQFFTIGVDKAGNRELAPSVADVRFSVARS